MESRPKLEITLTSFDKFMEFAGWAILVILWLLTVLNYAELPNEVPVQFNLESKPINFADKGVLFLFPALGTILMLVLAKLNQYPHIFNYAVEITERNAYHQYENATRMMRFMNVSIQFVFVISLTAIILGSRYHYHTLAKWLLPIIMGLTFIPTGYYIFKSFRLK